MEKQTLKSLKEEMSKFYKLNNELKRAKNQKEKKEVNKELDWHKNRMIRDFDLKEYDEYINLNNEDNFLFQRDVEDIILDIENGTE